jgi:hypothetical protein
VSTSNTTHRVSWARLWQALEMSMDIREMSMRDVAGVLGVSPSSLTRLKQGHALEADALASLVAWLYPSKVPSWVEPSPP